MAVICFVVYDLSIVGGVERVVESLANRLTEFYTIHILSLRGQSLNPALKLKDSIRIKSIDITEGRLRQQMLHAVPVLKKYFKDNHVEVAFLEATYAGFIGAPLGVLSKTKIVFCDHGAILNQINDNDITKMRRIAARFSNKVVVLTKKNKDDYEKCFRIKGNKVKCIYNWIAEETINPDTEYNFDSRVILSAGRFTKEKGYDLLIEVAKKVMPVHSDWQWHIYGEGPLESSIRKLVKKEGLEEFVVFKGFVEQMEDVYKKAALYVLPSYREGMPLVLLEAKAYKIPSVSFDIVTGPNEIISDEVNGCLIEPYDTAAMASCINWLIDNPELRGLLSQNSYVDIENYREDSILKQWISLINSLLKRK